MKIKIRASMQKKASEFMKDPKKKMREWWEGVGYKKKQLIKCLLPYSVLALVVFLVGHVLFGMANHVYFRYPFNDTSRHPFSVTANLTINGTDNAEIYAAEMYADNARSILCTLVGSEAAIVAIVISLTLIAIELTASEYSPRVIDVSLRNLDMWILLSIYGISIFYALVLIKQVPLDSRMLFEDVSLAFWLGVFSYVALGPYIWNISNLLKPENIIKRLASKIRTDEILNKKKARASIQPIEDIIRRSIMKYDFETMRVGLMELRMLMFNAIGSNDKKNNSNNITERVSIIFCRYLVRFSSLAESNMDEESIMEIIKNLEKFYKKCVESKKKKCDTAGWHVVASLELVGQTVVAKRFNYAAEQAIKSLYKVGRTAANEGHNEIIEKIAKFLPVVGTTAAEEGLEDAAREAASSILLLESSQTSRSYPTSSKKFNELYEQERKKMQL
jgi:hypothetical protein